MKKTILRVKDCDCNADGVEIYVEDYDSKEEAREALYQAILEYLNYGIEEIEIEDEEG